MPSGHCLSHNLDLLNDAREKTEELMDIAFKDSTLTEKPRNYREVARKAYLKTAQKRSKTKKEIRAAIRKQVGFVRRNMA